MVAPAWDLKPWIEVSEGLNTFENLVLVGLLTLRPLTDPGSVAKETLVNAASVTSAESWAAKNFRDALRLYCDQVKKPEVKISMEFIKTLATFLAVTLLMAPGAAVGFVFFAIGFGLDRWCDKYATKRFSGEGLIRKHLAADQSDVGTDQLPGTFTVTHRPAIVQLIEDVEAYPLRREKVQIKVPEITNGLVKVPSSSDVESISQTFLDRIVQSFEFNDDKTNARIAANFETIVPAVNEGPRVLSFSVTQLKI